MKVKKYLALSLAAFMTLASLGVMADSDVEDVQVPISEEVKEETTYFKYEGEVVEVNITENEEEKRYSILVKDDKEDPQNGLVLHLNDDVVMLNDKTMEFVSKDSFKKGMKVSAYYGENTPMMLSIPGQLIPDVIIINKNEEVGFVHVSNFNKDLVSMDNSLALNISEDTVMVDVDGNEVEKEDLENNDLIVFYSISTKSIPAQTTPEKVILMDKVEAEDVEEDEEIEENVLVLDKMTINNKEIKLDKPLYKKDGVTMFPIRQVVEELGYEVKWDNNDWSVELTKGVQWTKFAIGEDNYNFAKMIVKLGIAPEINDSSTYVPLSFLEEILQAEVEVNDYGMVEVVQ